MLWELCWAAVLLILYDVRAPPSSVITRRYLEVPGAGSLKARRKGSRVAQVVKMLLMCGAL